MKIKDIAKLAKVSEGTVDRVIHNRGGVSKKTDARVRKILREHNFSLNPIASALASKKKIKIICLIPKYNKQNQFWKSPALGIFKAEEEINRFGAQVKGYFFNQFNAASYIKKFNEALREEPDAVILAPIFKEETRQITTTMENRDIPYMFINVDSDDFNNISFIGQDAHTAGYIAGKLMSLSLPKDSVCAIVQTRKNVTDHNAISKRIQGFQDYLKEKKVSLKTEILKIGVEDEGTNQKEIMSFLKDVTNVRGVFVPSSRVSYVTSLFPENQIKSHLTILGFDTTEDNVRYLKDGKIQFLISQRSFNQGYEAVRMMFEFLIQKQIPERKVYSPIQIIIKENVDYDSRYKQLFLKRFAESKDESLF